MDSLKSCALALALTAGIVACSSSSSDAEPAPVDLGPATDATFYGAVDAYLVAYRDGIVAKQLQPTQEMWARAKAASAPLTPDADQRARGLVASLLDDALGFDFVHPTSDGLAKGGAAAPTGPAVTGYFRSVSNEATSAALVEAVRVGVAEAVAKGDPAMAARPVLAFFERNADYQPMHAGRCYPHGHTDYRAKAKSPSDCVSDAIQRGVGFMMRHVPEMTSPAPNMSLQPKAEAAGEASGDRYWYGHCGCYYSPDCPSRFAYCMHGYLALYGCEPVLIGGKMQDGVCTW